MAHHTRGVRRNARCAVLALLAMLVAVYASACGAPASSGGGGGADDYPSKDLEWLVPYGASSGADAMVRAIMDIIEEGDRYPKSMVVKNMEGGSGSTGYTRLYQQAGNPYVISPTVGSTITTPMQADTEWNIKDFTPVALMGRDDYVLAVKKDSPYSSLEEFVQAARKDTFSVGGTSKLSAAFIFDYQLAEQGDYETKYVPFEESGELTTALLSSSLDAIVTNPGEIAGQLRSGDIRALAFGGPERLPDLPDVPTVSEAGYEVDAYVPRGIVLPPETEAEVQQYWVDTMKFVASSPKWEEYLSKNYVTSQQAYGKDFGTRINELETSYKDVLTKAGVL